MIDIKLLREDATTVKNNMKKKFMENRIYLIDEILEIDKEWRATKLEADNLRKDKNTISKKINEVKKNKNIGAQGPSLSELFSQAKQIPKKIKELEQRESNLKEAADKLLQKIPNIMHSSVPKGKDDSENKEIKKWGETKTPPYEIKNHVELLEDLGLADFETAALMSGNGFYILKGDVALLNQALIRYTIEKMQSKGFTYIEPPLLIRKRVLNAAMDTEEFKNTIYSAEGEDLNMIGTSEHALLGLHEGKAIREQDLPLKYFSYSMCFRKEIGSHGINEKGLWRTHQFNKVEQFVYCKPEESYDLYEEMQAISEEIFQDLKLPYRIVECCSGDLASWKAKSADMEVYRPTTEDFGEVTSLSNCTDYQARGLNIKLIRKDGTREVVHTLNNTAIATSRALVAILENYQHEDGSISIPDVLQPFMFGKKIINKVKEED
ncbi:MAG: serine--tRNA ligase [Candidatus Nanoarchaeia archaeon]